MVIICTAAQELSKGLKSWNAWRELLTQLGLLGVIDSGVLLQQLRLYLHDIHLNVCTSVRAFASLSIAFL